MSASALYAGYVPMPGKWHSGVKLGGVNTVPIEFEVDPVIPDLGRDPLYPNRDFIVIPKGRIIATKALDLTYQSRKSLLTLANGVDPIDPPSFTSGYATIPAGYAPFHMYRSMYGLPADRPMVARHETIEIPYTSVNENYNTSTNGGSRLKVGEYVMPYYGTKNKQSSNLVPQDRGKLVRWVPRKVFSQTVTSSAVVLLDEAPFPFAKPKFIMAASSGTASFTAPSGITYDDTAGKWKMSFAAAVTNVVYEYGASFDQAIGQIMGIEPVGDAGGVNSGSNHELTGWLKWVTDNFAAWDWPPILPIRPSTSVTDEAVTITAGVGQLAHYPLIPFRTVTVKLSGTITEEDGTVTTYSDTAMSLADELFFNNQAEGKEYDIDWATGVIRLSNNVSVSGTLKVSYYYEDRFKDGLRFDAGILGLTDGFGGSGLVGLPPHLDVAGVRGVLKVAIL
jgi:hypothetical protein